VYFSKGEYDEAIKCYLKAIGINPNHVYYTNIGDSFRNKENLDRAILYYEEAIRSNPDYDPAYNSLGFTYYSKRDYSSAIKHYEKALSINSGNFIYFSNLGDAYSASEMWDEAIENYEKAIKINPDDDLSYNGLGNAYFGMGLYTKAIEQYEKAKNIKPDEYPVYYSNIGDANRRLRRWDNAIEYYEIAAKKATDIDPEDKRYYKSLGLAYNDRGVEYYQNREDDKAIRDYKKALEEYKKALETISEDRDYTVIHHNLYLVYNDKGMYKEAEESLREVIKLDPNNLTYIEELKQIKAKRS
ncbi:MAG: tetratricopeptide repeat protein, partial [Thermodesulfobacteriota bacterium]